MEGSKLNLNGEFFGISSLGVYSAPWFLQVVLLLMVGAMFYYKMAGNSRNLILDIQNAYNKFEDNNSQSILNDYKNKFLSFNIHKDNLPSYWAGFGIFVITFIYAIGNTFFSLI